MKKSFEAVSGIRLQAVVSLLCLVALGRAYGEVNGISDNALQQIAALQAEKASRTPAQLKLDSQLVYALKQAHGQPFASGVTSLRLGVKPAADGRYLVDMDAQVTQSLLATIAGSGGQVINSVSNFNTIRALVPLDQVEALAGRSDVRFIKPAVPAFTRTGSVDSQGDTTHRAAQARSAFNVDGFGVKVGVLSDSVDFMAQAQATGDLPANVTVLPGQAGSGAGEGTAMLEIVYDLAPGAQLFFASGFNGEAQFAQNILDLRAAGCDIIVDDISYFDESPFQDGIVARAVNAVTADGALYFSAAGNEGSKAHGTSGTWEGDFADGGAAGTPVGGKGGTLHSFGATAYDTVTGRGMATVLHWSDPLGASTNDYDLYVLDSTGATIVSSSTTVQNGSQDPFELVPPPNVGERIVVVKAAGDPRFLHIDTIRGQLSIGTDGNITGHAAATNAFACAAVDVHTAYPGPFTGGAANPVEYFSTDGPRRVFYNADGTAITPGNFLSTGGYVRQKPDITAADGVATTLPSNSGLNPFYGTSAAAPHAGAIAALLKSYNQSLSPSAIRNLLTTTALDNEAVGYDYNGGAGIVMAYQVLQATPAPGLVILSNSISGGNGNGVIDFNECNDLNVVLINRGTADATHVSGTLVTTTPGVVIAQSRSAYPDILTNSAATNLVPFKVSTSPAFVCGTPISLNMIIKTDQRTTTNSFWLPTGLPGFQTRFDNPGLYVIPDNDPTGASSPVVVSNVNSSIGKVVVSLDIIHPFDSDLQLELIAPDGTSCILSANNGGSGRNFGAGCLPDTLRTTFDDAAATSIVDGSAPFMGTFQPEQPLAIFSGKTGTNVNGIWQLHVVDGAPGDIGAIQCWSLMLYSTLCVDGGGTCPGANLVLGMTDAPDPVFLGTNLVYTITVTNLGPSLAKNAIITHVLPASTLYVAASPSQGTVAFANGVVTASLGNLDIGASATVRVTVQPTTIGTIFSTATVTSLAPEVDPSDNSATVATLVNPPASDLAVGLAAAPNPTLVGGLLTYSVAVTNFGPVPASGVTVTTALPSSVGFLSGTASQGNVTLQPGNLAVCSFGALAVNGRATATIQVMPGAAGTVVATATATANQTDPLLNNNVASVSTVVGPAVDLEVSITDMPDPVVRLGQLKYKITIANHGPSTATGVLLNGTLASGLTVTSNYVSQGTLSINSGTLTGNLGPLGNGGTLTAWVYVTPSILGTNITSVNVASPEADPNPANNSAVATTLVADPFVAIAPAGASLEQESFTPVNGAIDIGETVTVNLQLVNVGNVTSRGVQATLLAGNGVTPIMQTNRIYGDMTAGALVGQPFAFTATGTNGGTVTATLQVSDASGYSTNVSFIFPLPKVVTFANTNLITIPDSGPATPYPSAINVSGISAQVTKVTATLVGLSHTFPHDVNVLLVGPTGASTVLMAHVADEVKNLTDVTLTFDDAAPAPLPADNTGTGIYSGSWQPTAYSAPEFPTNAPASPYGVALSVFNGVNPNGRWSLYVYDDWPGDQGQIANGWSLAFTTITPVEQLADLGLTGTLTPNPVHLGDNLLCSFVVTNAGPATDKAVNFTNVLPAAATLLAVSNSLQTTCSTSNGVVTCNLGDMSSGAVATVTLVLKPTVNGWLTNTASVTGAQVDLHLSDNSLALAAYVVSNYADLAVSQTVSANPALAGGANDTFTLTVTNAGPNTAVNVLLTNLLPPGFSFVTAAPTPFLGTNGGPLAWNLGDLAPSNVVSVVLTAMPVGLGMGTNLVQVSSAGSSDTNQVDNTASLVVTNLSPVVAAGASLLAESFSPPNGSVDPGEQITVSLALANAGLQDITNLQATLLATNGVTLPSAPQPYGLLTHGGAAVARTFSFKAGMPVGGAFVATLALANGNTDLGTVAFTFLAPGTSAFTNANAIVIPDHGAAAPYPAPLNVSGLSGLISKVTVTLNGFTHAFPSDVNAVLVNPAGVATLLMSHCGGGYALTGTSFTLDDAAGAPLPVSTPVANGGVYRPAAYNGAVTLPGAGPTPYGASLAALNGSSPNGTWKLYVYDDSVGDAGNISSWTLNITTVQTINPAADLVVRMTASPSSVYQLSPITYSITVTNQGPTAASGVVLTDVLPAGMSVSSVNLSGGTYTLTGGILSLNVGSLAVGAGASATVRVAPAQAGSPVNSVRAALNETDLNLANNAAQATTAVQVAPPAVLAIQRSGSQLQLTITGLANQTYALQMSTNLVNPNAWTGVLTNQAPADGIIKYQTLILQGTRQRYYRAVRIP